MKIDIVKDAFSMKNDLVIRRISTVVKKKIFKALICSVTWYNLEAWSLRKETKRKLEAFEM